MISGKKEQNYKKRPAEKASKGPRRGSLRRRISESPDFKRQTFYALENIRKGNLAAKIVGGALFALIIANAVVVCVSIQLGLDPVRDQVLSNFYFISTLCFGIEYAARLWIADLAFGDCTRLKARLKYAFSPLGIIDFLSFAPSMLSWFLPVTPMLIHAIGVLRLIRLVKVTRYMRGMRTIGRVLSKRYSEIIAAFLVIGLLLVVASVAMFEVEHAAQPREFDNLLSGLWWAAETVTGTGYGDIVPITPVGRLLGGIIMVLSVGLIAIPGGILSAGFVAEFQNANLRKIERDVRHNADREQREQRERQDGRQQADNEGQGGLHDE